jgi:hypothetical protein
MGYRGKLEQQERARQLRAQAWTLQEIADELDVAKSSVSVWVRDVDFEPKPRRTARRRDPNVLQRRKQEEIERLLREGRERIGRLSEREFLMAGVALYAGEGAKRDGYVAFSNSDHALVGFFCAWLRRFFDVDEDRLRVKLYLHQGLDLAAAVEHWAAVTGITPAQFGKPYRAVPDGGVRHSKHVFGCATVGYSCARTHRTIMGLIRALLHPSLECLPSDGPALH